jgi:hypothetical protein
MFQVLGPVDLVISTQVCPKMMLFCCIHHILRIWAILLAKTSNVLQGI